MKKVILFICGCLFSLSIFADKYYDLSSKKIPINVGFIKYNVPAYQHDKLLTMQYYTVPFRCTITTNYKGNDGFGVKIYFGSLGIVFPPGQSDDLNTIITSENPLIIDFPKGRAVNLYNYSSQIRIDNYGCSPYDKNCPKDRKAIIYAQCEKRIG